MQNRGQFSSRFGFLMAATGSAVGLGNIWSFPTNTASNGGGAFVLAYFILAFSLAYPALMAELIIGRHTRSNIVAALSGAGQRSLARNVGKFTGLYGVLIASVILSFYALVAGWMMAHLLAAVAAAAQYERALDWLTSFGTARNVIFCSLFSLLTIFVVAHGIERGIERWSRRLMPALITLMLALIAYVLTLPGATTGLQLYLLPDFSQISNPQLLISALGQAFFSLSLGVGTMMVYGSYIRAEENLPATGALVTLIDTAIAFLAGLIILPALFAAQRKGLQIYNTDGSLISGPGLIFETLPMLFAAMGVIGYLVSFAFFTLMTIAALTSSISMLEVPVAYATERFELSRRRLTWIVGALIFTCSTVLAVNFDALFDLVVDVTTKYSQPLLGIVICVFAGWVFNRNRLLAEIQRGYPNAEHSLFWKLWPPYVRYFCPLLIIAVFAQAVIH